MNTMLVCKITHCIALVASSFITCMLMYNIIHLLVVLLV